MHPGNASQVPVAQQLVKQAIQDRAGIIEMANRLRRSIHYNESFDSANRYNSAGLASNLKGVVDVWEAEQLGRIAEATYPHVETLNQQPDAH